ncbi:MAG: hypothetical protein R3F11_13250 [Verrucomicrobiales bacterium]
MSDQPAPPPPPGNNPYQAPSAPPPHAAPQQTDATGGLIPYKNPPALWAYYLAVFSLIPFLGFFTGVAAVILGLKGLRRYKENPMARGVVHAWIGIIGGGVFALLYGAAVVLIIVAFITG